MSLFAARQQAGGLYRMIEMIDADRHMFGEMPTRC
jgi:hypothetical protein